MTYDQLARAVKAGQFSRVYLFYGPETWIRDRAVAAIRQKLLPPGFEDLNLSLMEGDVSLSDLRDASQTLPMMGEKRIIILRDWLALTKAQAAPEADAVAPFLQSVPDTCCVIILAGETLDGRRKFVQALRDGCETVEFPLLSGSDLHKHCLAHIAPKTIDFTALEQLIFMTGRSLTALCAELDKLSAYIGERTEITQADVDAIATPSAEADVFRMIELFMNNRQAEAYALRKTMLENGEKCAGLIALFIRQMRMLTHIRLMRDQGIALPEIERRLSLNHYAAARAAGQAARYPAETLVKGYEACVSADYAFKSGRMRDEAALDDLMLRLGMMR